jgi:putative addiction module component (TIGR02574 family)
MAVSIESLGIERLSVSERLDLIEQIWDSLPEQLSSEAAPHRHLEEIERRRAQRDLNPGDGKHWREVLDHLEQIS